MRANLLFSIVLACCALAFGETANAQTDQIKVRFRVDGKEVHHPFRIEISLNGFVLKPKVENGSFPYPAELLNDEKVDLRFISGKYDLDFENVPLKKFHDIVISVDNRPFAEENLSSDPPPDKELVFIYSISYGRVESRYHIYK